MNKTIRTLRRKYPTFLYKSCKWGLVKDGLKIVFVFEVEPDIKFSPEVLIEGVTKSQVQSLEQSVIENFVLHLGMMEIPSYWKATCSPQIIIKAGNLSDEQIKWWYNLLIDGMGQFYYENKVDFRNNNFTTLKCDNNRDFTLKRASVTGDKTLIPIGGGKDSAVTVETLSRGDFDKGAFALNPTKASKEVIKKAEIKQSVFVHREIDGKLLELNSKGYLNGHTPIMAYLSFLSTFVAYLFGYKNIAFSNEKSSDEENIEYLGTKINHQWDKSFEFEERFRSYNSKYLSNINYFSFLRPLYEIQISKLFSKHTKYHDIFRSCNIGQQKGIWCCECPKCLSTFILIYPFVSPEVIRKIFPSNLFEDKSLEGLLIDLVDESRIKPFECVGTREEITIALFLSLKYHGTPLPYLLEFAQKKYLLKEKDLQKRAKRILTNWDKKNNLSKEFEKILKKEIE